MTEQQQVHLFTSQDGQTQLEVALDQETVWLTQAQMGAVFDTTPENVLMHLKNIFSSGELDQQATAKDFLVVRQEGRRQVRRKLKHYSLDAVISVGYRVNSKRATQFRQWATNVLKQHLVQGYTLNQKRLTERGIEFEQAVALLSRTLSNQQLIAPSGEAVVQVISDYARSWSLLQGYDEQSLADVSIRQDTMLPLPLDDVLAAVAELKQTLIAKGEATELFGKLVAESLPEQKDLMIRLIEHFILLREATE